MKKSFKFLTTCLLGLSLVSMTACNKDKEPTFNFDKDLFVGVQAHYYEVRKMEPTNTSDFISETVGALGTKVFRLNVTLETLFLVDNDDTVKFNSGMKQTMHKIVEQLQNNGVERILYVTDTFLFPYGYSHTHSKCVPDPYKEKDMYLRWLDVNAKAFGMIAAEYPEVKYFEPMNEPDIAGEECVCKNGMIWGTKDPNFQYSDVDETNILADLCFYQRRSIKAVSKDCMLTTPGFTSLKSCEGYLEHFYQAIESGAHPIKVEDACSVNPDDYFDIVNIHPYSFVSGNVNPAPERDHNVYVINDDYVNGCRRFYDICVKHGDAEKPHWYTEIGFTDESEGDLRKQIIGRETTHQLQLISEKLPFVECVIFYVLTDLYEFTVSGAEDRFGLFTGVGNPEEDFEIKPITMAIYDFINNGDGNLNNFETKYPEFVAKIDAIREKYSPLYK